ncbi:MAG: SDR family oxidoreductase [Acidimicrobiaceae bacterium]|nr:SDR family oxidoreductase [Acidimicrobiaceae bacterium]
MPLRFEDRVAIVTGAAGAFGKATARQLLDGGAKVVAVDWDGVALDKAISELRSGADPTSVTPVIADVSSEADVDGYVRKALDTYGEINLFFNNAGIEGKMLPIVELEVVDFDRVMAVNARGVFMGLRAVLKVMKAQGKGGAIVNTSSQAGIKGGRNFSPYIASKHAVVGLSRTAALEGAAYGVRVNAIAPGFIDTRMLHDLAGQINAEDVEKVYAGMGNQVPVGRLGTADEVATLATFLLSDDAAYVSGNTVLIDGALNA